MTIKTWVSKMILDFIATVLIISGITVFIFSRVVIESSDPIVESISLPDKSFKNEDVKDFYFDKYMFFRSDVASNAGIKNSTDDPQINNNIDRVVDYVSELQRKLYTNLRDDVDLEILSGYRSPEANRLVKGGKRSDHLDGRAVDIRADGLKSLELIIMIDSLMGPKSYDKIIREPGGVVHISLAKVNNKPRGLKIDTFLKKGGGRIYKVVKNF